MVSGVNAFFSCKGSGAAPLKASAAQENIPATASARDKYRFMVEPPLLSIKTLRIMSCAAGHSNEARIPFAYLFYIVANY
jgi:hypothetical protein